MFSFKLQKVLDYKQALEEEKKQQLGEAFRGQHREETLLIQYKEEKQAVQQPVSGPIDLNSLMHTHYYLNVLEEQIDAQTQRLSTAENMVKEKRAELVSAMQERQVLDKLKERQQERYVYEFNVKQQKLLDEVATTSFVRKES